MKRISLNNNVRRIGNEAQHSSLSIIYYPLFILIIFSLFFSCTDMVPTKEVRLIDSLNGTAYAYRYRNLDSSYKYAEQAYSKVNFYKSGKAEALNNLGFWAFMNMDFDRAEAFHKEVYKLTKNELELFIDVYRIIRNDFVNCALNFIGIFIVCELRGRLCQPHKQTRRVIAMICIVPIPLIELVIRIVWVVDRSQKASNHNSKPF